MSASLFKTTKNTRYLLPENHRYIRSDVPDGLTSEEENWLLENNFLTVVDLRQKEEWEARKCPLEDNGHFKYYHLPVTGGNIIPEAPCMVARSYINMVDERMWEIIGIIENADSNVIYFCSAGKDRTGVVSALLLTRMGIGREYIVEDYVKSAENWEEALRVYARENPDIDVEVVTPRKAYMEEFLDRYDKLTGEGENALAADGVLRGVSLMAQFMTATFTDLILRVVLAALLSGFAGATTIL